MFHVVYVSRPTRPFVAPERDLVLADARAFNAERGVTGVLVQTAAGFVQLLEGEREAVEEVFRRVATSTRHDEILRTPAIEVAERVFPDWDMGFEAAPPGAFVERVLTPLVRHELIDGTRVRDVLVERFLSLPAA